MNLDRRTFNATAIVVASLAMAGAPSANAQDAHDPAAAIAAQRDAMTALRSMDGAWRGPAWVLMPNGDRREFVQTERIGPFLDGSVKVIEGRGHGDDGRLTFNALGIVAYDPAARTYSFHSYAQGRQGDFAFRPTADGYAWDIAAGPATIRYTAVIRDGTFREIGERVVPGQPPLRIFEMNLKRVGDTDWPLAGAIGPR